MYIKHDNDNKMIIPEFPNPEEKEFEKWKIKEPCRSLEHNFPSHLYIPPGQSHTHTCPGCGNQITVTQPIIYC